MGAPCYHMIEVRGHPEHPPIWTAAAKGERVAWVGLLEGYAAAVDGPSSAFCPELSQAYPEAVIVLSARSSESWWKSASNTIFPTIEDSRDRPEWYEMVDSILGSRFTMDLTNKEACIAAFERHNAEVLRSAPADRLVVWRASDGWDPLCKALNLPVPQEPFPISNSTEEFQAMIAARKAEAAVTEVSAP